MKSRWAVLWFILLPACGVDAPVDTATRSNFIVIYSDDQRQDAFGAEGNPAIITPTLDQMAQKAVHFTNANVVFSLCSPSRAAILTGRYGSANGVLHLDSKLNPEERTIAAYLKEAGYQTAISGKWHIQPHPKEVGFDFHVFFEGNGAYYNRVIQDMGNEVRPEEHCDEYCVDRSIDFLEDAVSNNRPFFLFHNTQLPHMNGELKWDARQQTLAKYNVADMPVAKTRLDDLSSKPEYLKTVRNRVQAAKYGYPDAEAIQRHTKEYYAVITEMDDALGRLFKAIDRLGLRENTYIIFMSDNGWMLGEHGFTSKVLPYRPSTRVPMFILGPGLTPRTEEGIALNIDVAPTLLDLAGIRQPGGIHGKSLVPVITGKAAELRDAFVYEGLGSYGGAKPNLTVISNKYRYIETFENESLSRVTFRELYDQSSDPEEMENLVHDRAYDAKLREFNGLVKEHMTEILNKKHPTPPTPLARP
ncbi:MAG: sulfatase-like hydrolase/transferase [Luteitalea sp.]|nr:sulfatase-like hydrolase/transferase [Luteitalea sp.]